MVSFWMLRRVAHVRTDVSEELSASFIRVASVASYSECCSESPILVTLMKEALSSSYTSVLTRATRRNIPEDTILCGLLLADILYNKLITGLTFSNRVEESEIGDGICISKS
jgi:hypothetical protein